MTKTQINTDILLNVGAHFGHPSSRWNPKFEKFISSKKNGIHIIDLIQTEKCLKRAAKEIEIDSRNEMSSFSKTTPTLPYLINSPY